MELQTTIASTLTLDQQHFIAQDWSAYDREQHRTWALLYSRRMRQLRNLACNAFFLGVETIGLRQDCIPDLREMNPLLAARTGWEATAVDGFLSPRLFFECLAARRFPTTVTIRPMEQLDYLPEPDIFHDVFGHVPMHADPRFADMLQRFGAMGATASSERELERLARFFWFTVEFGLVREQGAVRVYGSGLISSAEDCANALSEACDRRPFNLDQVLRQPFDTNKIQQVLFVIESFEELEERMRQW